MNPWLLAILFLLALAALAALVRAAARTVRGARLCAVPLRTSQTVDFTTAGRVVLCLEGPRFTQQFRKLRFELRQPDSAEVPGHRILFRLVSSGVSRARVTLRTYDLSMVGRHKLDSLRTMPARMRARCATDLSPGTRVAPSRRGRSVTTGARSARASRRA